MTSRLRDPEPVNVCANVQLVHLVESSLFTSEQVCADT